MNDSSLVDSFLSEIESEGKKHTGFNKGKLKYSKTKQKMTSLEARRAVEELLELRHYVDNIYDEAY